MNVTVGFILMCFLSALSFNRIYAAENTTNIFDVFKKVEDFFSGGPRSGLAIQCYRCNSTSHRECLEKLIHPSTLKPESCSDVFEARYCIKTTGFYEGEVGDQRFCSARDLGNYCEYKHVNENEREYRSCVYTCSTDGCNSASSITSYLSIMIIPWIVTAALFQRL